VLSTVTYGPQKSEITPQRVAVDVAVAAAEQLAALEAERLPRGLAFRSALDPLVADTATAIAERRRAVLLENPGATGRPRGCPAPRRARRTHAGTGR
jgi:hypothetical protein